jgi:beta-lactamase superfamily II metal-dependent hydrolase
MPWELEISTIDVGQGESSLIIAQDSPFGATRTMLIDCGLPGYAQVTHNYISKRFAARGITALDHILLSHYDDDHSGGVSDLLNNDNLYAVSQAIAASAAAAAAAARTRSADANHQLAAAAAAAAATIMGAYDLPGKLLAYLAVDAGKAAEAADLGKKTTEEIANAGIGKADKIIEDYMRPHKSKPITLVNDSLIYKTKFAMEVARIAAYKVIAKAVSTKDAAAWTRAARPAVWGEIKSSGSFDTGGIYNKTSVIDIGDLNAPAGYVSSIQGRAIPKGTSSAVIAPGVNRQRTSIGPSWLTKEVLWNSGAGKTIAPAGSPAAFVVACQAYVWGKSTPITGGQAGNDVSIALILRFGEFFYYTGGDLPYQGEDPIADAVMKRQLPNPQGGLFALPDCIAAFKAGHHGSGHSTSAKFLTTIKPSAAFISCGKNTFGKGDKHPNQELINRLAAKPQTRPKLYYYLTNCKYFTDNVPASAGKEELSDNSNRSRLCGDNDNDNKRVGRKRGDIRLDISQAQAAGTGRKFTVTYWEHDDAPASKTAIGFRPQEHDF